MKKKFAIIFLFVVILGFVHTLNGEESDGEPSAESSTQEFKDQCCCFFYFIRKPIKYYYQLFKTIKI
jgi:hypothetical protein